VERKLNVYIVIMNLKAGLHNIKVSVITVGILHRAKKKICGFPVSSYKNLGRVILVPEVYFYYFPCEGERKNKPLVESGN
jgi:hypothetical protein